MAANRPDTSTLERMMPIKRVGFDALMGFALMLAAPAQAQDLDGKSLFLKNCSACHQPDGRGIPGAFPALAGNSFVQGKASEVAAVPLTGRNAMPNFSKHLSDGALAAILSYVRAAWGNAGTTITAEQIATVRAELHSADFDPSPQNDRH